MDKEQLAQLKRWHEEDEHQQIVDYIQAIPSEARDYEGISCLARAYNNLDRYGEGLEQLLSIAEEGREDPLWHFRTGYSYYYLKQYEQAVEAFERSDSLEPGDGDTRMLLEWSRNGAQRGKREQARRAEALSRADVQADGNGSSLDAFIEYCRDFWEDSDYARKEYVSAPPGDDLIASVEQELGYKLPASYIAMMKQQNGGIPRNTCFPVEEATSWAEDHIAITGIAGIGRDTSYALCGDLGSRFMIEEWGYPDIGVVIGDCPSAGHDVVMLDYRHCGPDGEPEVIHVDQEGNYEITFLAKDYESFIRGLVSEEAFDTSEEDKEDDLRRVTHGAFSPLLQELTAKFTEIDNIEGIIRSICKEIVQEKGHFSLHADERSTLMYDLQFSLYTNAYPETSREQYLEDYSKMIAFGGEFSTGGYAPGFITDWLDNRIQLGMIVEREGIVRLTDKAQEQLLEKLKEAGTMDNADIKPFILVEQSNGGKSVILSVGSYKADLFAARADEGFEGNGYDWGSLAAVFLEEQMPELSGIIRFDPEADMFCAYSSDGEAVVAFAAGFKRACEDDALIRDLFSRAELD
ncbi:Imm51 family immunity protein [Paenibacillus sp. MMS20-IR301]|uniref:Imm51 family immunity protein n=1 Tax=Paenibacillus sp. MMS20-IR301 TaxID=2895946 RepID=UPI0028F064B0|nr:Imm51 family immunity protein [Paenibacillus sp. MMS20-IR301]WNS42373.1 Imm51 family immunity protein [Paenibacillus sp. MMS20-IR301]